MSRSKPSTSATTSDGNPGRHTAVDRKVHVVFYSSAFCEPCRVTRGVLADVVALLPRVRVDERDVARFPDEAEADRIRSTPTVLILDGDGNEVFRAAGAPTLDQVLTALARAV